MINELIKNLSAIDNIAGIVLGGSRGINIANHNSDYDIALYRTCDKAISSEIIADNIPKHIEVNVNPVLVSGHVNGVKFEIFQKNFISIQQEIDNNVLGKFRWYLSPLLPYGDLSYRMVSHLVNSKILYDRDGKLKNAVEKVSPIPELFKKSVINHFFKQMNNASIHVEKVNKIEDQFHVMSLIGLIFFCYVNILYVANNRYPIIEKGNFLVATSLPNIPIDFIQRISNVYSAASAFEYANARVLLKALVTELKSIVYEDQKK